MIHQSRIFKFASFLIILILASVSLLPIIYLASTAFKPMDELLRFPPLFFVRNPTLRNFTDLSAAVSGFTVAFSRYAFNSIFTTTISVTGAVFVCSMAAFSLSKLKPAGRDIIFSIIIAALMFSPQVTTIPMYTLMTSLKLTNTFFALILPKLAVSYYAFLMKQFFDQIPDSLIESARMDGAGNFTIYIKLVMPIGISAWVTVSVFALVANWNDYIGPMIFTNIDSMKTLTLAIQTIGNSTARMGAVSAASFLMLLPVIIVFVLLQRKVIDTMVYSGIKG